MLFLMQAMGYINLINILKNLNLFLSYISHFHLDHVSGLHVLNKFSFPQGINIFVPKGRKKDFETLIAPPFTIPPQNLRMKVTVSETEAIEQFHAYGDHGYRVTLEDKIIAYSGDCGISKSSIPLAKDADLLIHECSYQISDIRNQTSDKWGHVGPIEAAQLAKDAGVKKLILTHFDASQYTTLEARIEAEKQAQKIFPSTTAATDDMVVNL